MAKASVPDAVKLKIIAFLLKNFSLTLLSDNANDGIFTVAI